MRKIALQEIEMRPFLPGARLVSSRSRFVGEWRLGLSKLKNGAALPTTPVVIEKWYPPLGARRSQKTMADYGQDQV